jgi:transposase
MDELNLSMFGVIETELSAKQEMTIELALQGMKDGEIAKQVGVTRKTINTWRNHDEDFRIVLAKRRRALREQHQDELSGLVSEAIGVMREAMREDNMPTQLRAAQAVLRTAGLQAEMKKEKPLSKEEIIFEFLGEITRHVREEKGYFDPKELPNGANNSPVKSY